MATRTITRLYDSYDEAAQAAVRALEAAGVDPAARGERLDITDFARVAAALAAA
jgi:16S rRNA (adenine1518-N6/adenine1519-N6)-dimethyltransferase